MKYLIDTTYLKKRTPINFQKDESEILVALNAIEFFYLRKLLTKDLYKHYSDYVNQTQQAPVTLTDIQKEVFELSQYYFAIMVQWEILGNSFKIVEKGLIQADNSVEIELVKSKRNELYNRAEAIKSEIVLVLNSNKAEFEALYPFETVEENAKSTVTNGSSPIVFVQETKKWYGQ